MRSLQVQSTLTLLFSPLYHLFVFFCMYVTTLGFPPSTPRSLSLRSSQGQLFTPRPLIRILVDQPVYKDNETTFALLHLVSWAHHQVLGVQSSTPTRLSHRDTRVSAEVSAF